MLKTIPINHSENDDLCQTQTGVHANHDVHDSTFSIPILTLNRLPQKPLPRNNLANGPPTRRPAMGEDIA